MANVYTTLTILYICILIKKTYKVGSTESSSAGNKQLDGFKYGIVGYFWEDFVNSLL